MTRQSIISRFFYKLSSALEPHRRVVLLIAVVIIALAGYRFSQQKLDLSAVSLIPDSSPELVRISDFLDINPSSRVTLVEFKSSSPEDAEVMQGMAGKLESALAAYMEQSQSQGMPSPEKLMALVPYLFDAEARELVEGSICSESVNASVLKVRESMLGLYGFAPKEYLRADPLGWLTLLSRNLSAELFQGSSFSPTSLGSYPVSEDGHYVLLILRPKSDLYDVQSALDIMSTIDRTLAEMFEPYGGRISANVVGGPRFTAENAMTIDHDLKFTVGLSLLCLAVIYLVTVRSLGAIWLLLTPVVAVILAGSSLTLIWPTTAGLAIAFGAAVLGIAVDFAVLVHFALRRNVHKIPRPQIIAAVARPMVFSASLCIASFCVLMVSGLPALRQLGFFAASSLFFGILIATMVLPYCPWIDRPKLKPQAGPYKGGRLNPKALPTILICLALAGATYWGLGHVPFDTSVQKLGVNTEQIQAEVRELRSHWNSGPEPYFWLSAGITQDEALEASSALVSTLRARGALAFSLSDVLPSEREQKENLGRWKDFVEEHGETIRQELRDAALGNGFNERAFSWFDGWLAEQRRAAGGQLSDVQPDTLEKMLYDAGLGDLFWWMRAHREGEHYVFTYSNMEVDEGALPAEIQPQTLLFSINKLTEGITTAFDREIWLLPIAGIVCLVLLLVCFVRPIMVVLACLPPLFGLTSVVMWQYFSGSSLTLAGVAALTLVIGLGADYGIVMLHELSSKMSFGAFRSILVSGLTTLSGLGVLILAQHPVLKELGSITFFGLGAEMIAVLIIVPILCKQKEAENAD